MTLLGTETRTSQPRTAARYSRAEVSGVWPWVWMVIACTFLAIFGVVRLWQDGRHQLAIQLPNKPPFALALIPKTLGVWRVKEDARLNLIWSTEEEKKIVDMTGSIGEPLKRLYVDKETGVTLAVLILFGPAEKVTGHTPEVCYPSAGYELVESFDVKLTLPQPVNYRSLLFVKNGGAAAMRNEVFYTFRQTGNWSPIVSGNWKTLETSPPVFKVQIQRSVTEREHRGGVKSPCQNFLDELIPEIDRLVASVRQPDNTPRPPVDDLAAKKE